MKTENHCSTAFRFPNVTLSQGTPNLVSAPGYHGPPSTSTIGVFVRARFQHLSDETGGVVTVSRRRDFQAEQLPVLRVDGRPEEVPRPLHLHLRLVDRDRLPAPPWWGTEQRLRPVIPLPCCLIRCLIEEAEHLCRLPARQAIVQQRDSRSTEPVSSASVHERKCYESR